MLLLWGLLAVADEPRGAKVMIGDQVIARFGELRAGTKPGDGEVMEFQDGDDLFLRVSPGSAKFGEISLQKGYLVSQDLQDWWKVRQAGQDDRRDLRIVMREPGLKTILSGTSCAPTSVDKQAVTFQCETITTQVRPMK